MSGAESTDTEFGGMGEQSILTATADSAMDVETDRYPRLFGDIDCHIHPQDRSLPRGDQIGEPFHRFGPLHRNVNRELSGDVRCGREGPDLPVHVGPVFYD